MATCCGDCIHNAVCGIDGHIIKCEHFKNKADFVEVKHGKWILTKTEHGWNCCEYPSEYTCSVCGRTETQEEPYCHCGAKMDGRKDDK